MQLGDVIRQLVEQEYQRNHPLVRYLGTPQLIIIVFFILFVGFAIGYFVRGLRASSEENEREIAALRALERRGSLDEWAYKPKASGR